MKVLKRKNKPLIIAALALVLAILITAAIVIPIVLTKNNEPKIYPPPELMYDEYVAKDENGNYKHDSNGVYTKYVYPTIEENKFLVIRITGAETDYAFRRMEDSILVSTDKTDEEGNAVKELINTSAFQLDYWDEEGNFHVYEPKISELDPTFEFENLYASSVDATMGTSIYKILYLTTAIGSPLFNERMDFSSDAAGLAEAKERYGLTKDKCITVSFTYIDSENEEKTHKIEIGDGLLSGRGYYFTVDDRPCIYTTNTLGFSYALEGYTSYINPILTAAGLEMDKALAPYLTSDLKHFKNTMHTSAEDCPGCDGTGRCERVILIPADKQDTVRVVLDAKTFVPYDGVTKLLSTQSLENGYYKADFEDTLFDLGTMRDEKAYKNLINVLLGRGNGALDENIFVTLPSYSNSVELENGVSKKYIYTISAVEAILTSDGADITASGTPVPENSKIKVSYTLRIDGGKPVSEHPMHAVIDLSSDTIPADIKSRLNVIGAVEGGAEFDVIYNTENSVKKKIELVISEVISVLDSEGNSASKVEEGTRVVFGYYLMVDGERRNVSESGVVSIDDEMTEYDSQCAAVLMGKKAGDLVESVAMTYDAYEEVFADLITYEIKGINYFIESDCVVSYEFQQPSERDPFYGGSIYKNTLDNQYSVYGLNSTICEEVAKFLGGSDGTTTGQATGLIGLETVAIGLTPEVLEHYGLYAYTIYFELPRGLTPVSSGDDDLDDYKYYSTLGFTLYISEEQVNEKDGSKYRYIASDLYDLVAKISADNFVFLDHGFVDFYARRDLILTDIANIKNVSFDFFMEEIYGSYSNELTHQPVYPFEGKYWSGSDLLLELERRGDDRTLEDFTPIDLIRIFTLANGDIDSFSDTEFKEYYKTLVPTYGVPNRFWEINGVDYGAFMHHFYDNQMVDGDTLATDNFKLLMEMIYYISYENFMSEEEQAEALANAPCLMKITLTLGEPYGDDDTLHDKELAEGIYSPSSLYDYTYEFYHASDRKIMVRVSREDRASGDIKDSASAFYISTFSFKKIVNGYMDYLNKVNIDKEASPYVENVK